MPNSNSASGSLEATEAQVLSQVVHLHDHIQARQADVLRMFDQMTDLSNDLPALRSTIEGLFSDFASRYQLQRSLIEMKNNHLVRARQNAQALEGKITTLRERAQRSGSLASSMTTSQNASTTSTSASSSFDMSVAEKDGSPTKQRSCAQQFELMQIKYAALKAEYFQNVLTTYGRKVAGISGSAKTAKNFLAKTFEAYLQQHEQEIEKTVLAEGDKPATMGLLQPTSSVDNTEGPAAPTGFVCLVFTDVQSSTELWDQAEPAMAVALEMHNVIMRKLLREYHGYEVKTQGDAFMVAFESPLCALKWCAAVQRELVHAEWPAELLAFSAAARVVDPTNPHRVSFNGLRVRMGIHGGTPKCEMDPVSKRMDYFGPMVNLSARISSLAQGGQIVVSAEFLSLVSHLLPTILDGIEATSLGMQNFKGVSRPVAPLK